MNNNGVISIHPFHTFSEIGANESHKTHRNQPDRGGGPWIGVRRLQLYEGNHRREAGPDRTQGRGKGTCKRSADSQRRSDRNRRVPARRRWAQIGDRQITEERNPAKATAPTPAPSIP